MVRISVEQTLNELLDAEAGHPWPNSRNPQGSRSPLRAGIFISKI
jgi:hypothetical protein